MTGNHIRMTGNYIRMTGSHIRMTGNQTGVTGNLTSDEILIKTANNFSVNYIIWKLVSFIYHSIAFIESLFRLSTTLLYLLRACSPHLALYCIYWELILLIYHSIISIESLFTPSTTLLPNQCVPKSFLNLNLSNLSQFVRVLFWLLTFNTLLMSSLFNHFIHLSTSIISPLTLRFSS